jgi:putative membrane protein (TIGR04086 family)
MSKTQENFTIILLKGVCTALITTLVGILLFSIIVKVASLNTTVIKVVNQFIKLLSVFLGCFFSVKGGKGFVKGLLIGVIATLITYLLFSLIGGQKFFSLALLIDLLFGIAIGTVSGIVAVNVKRG